MRYLIIGLGIYGTNLAKYLTDLGNEVIGADNRAANVDSIKDYVSTAYVIDSTDPTALGVLPLKNVDVTIVAIGENFGASIKTVAQLRRLGVRKIFARAADELHRAILEGMQVTRILNPEKRAAYDLVNELELGTGVESLRVDADRYIVECPAPPFFYQMRYSSLPDQLHGLKLISASRHKDTENVLGLDSKRLQMLDLEASPQERILPGDVLTLFGTDKNFKALFRALN